MKNSYNEVYQAAKYMLENQDRNGKMLLTQAVKAYETFSLNNNPQRRAEKLAAALKALVIRCDGAEGVQPDGSNMDTFAAHQALKDAGFEL